MAEVSKFHLRELLGLGAPNFLEMSYSVNPPKTLRNSGFANEWGKLSQGKKEKHHLIGVLLLG